MQLHNTIMFIPPGETEIIKIEIYTSEEAPESGYWNVDNNKVLLTSQLYSQFKSCKTQAEQKKFFSQLKQVSNTMI